MVYRLRTWGVRLKYGDINIYKEGYSNEYDAGIVAEYLSRRYYGDSIRKAFIEIGMGDLEALYNAIEEKYKDSHYEKVSKNNQGKPKTKNEKSSDFIGTTLDKSRNKWMAQITYRMQHVNLGRYSTPQYAGFAYNVAADYLFGSSCIKNDVIVDKETEIHIHTKVLECLRRKGLTGVAVNDGEFR